MTQSAEHIETNENGRLDLFDLRQLTLALGAIASAGTGFIALATEGMDRVFGSDVVPDTVASALVMSGFAVAGTLGAMVHLNCMKGRSKKSA